MVFILALNLMSCPNGFAKDQGKIQAGVGLVINQVDPRQADIKEDLKSQPFLGVSVAAQGYLRDWLILEAVGFFSRYQFFVRDSAGNLIKDVSKRIRIPFTVRFAPFRYFSVGGGFYGSYLIGSVREESSFSVRDRTSAFDAGEHGIEGVAGVWLPFDERWSLHLDFRSSFSLTPRNGESRSWNALNLLVFMSL